jgi:hypothetical protein
VLDAKVIVLDGIAGRGVAIGAGKIDEVGVDEREHILG